MFGIKKGKIEGWGALYKATRRTAYPWRRKMEQKRKRKGKGNRKRKLKRMEQRKELEK
jgi:hypothetical protein